MNVEVRGAYLIELSEAELREIARARCGAEDPRTLETVANEAASLEIVELGLGFGVEVEPLSFMRAAESSAVVRQSPVIFARNFKSHGTHLVNERWVSADGSSALRCVMRRIDGDRRLRLGPGCEMVLPAATEWSDVIRDAMIQDVMFYLCTGAMPIEPTPEAKLGGVAGFVADAGSHLLTEVLAHVIGLGLLGLVIWAIMSWL